MQQARLFILAAVLFAACLSTVAFSPPAQKAGAETPDVAKQEALPPKQTVPPPVPQPPPLATENDALALALQDIRTIVPDERYEVRYVWARRGDLQKQWRTINWILNRVSRASIIRQCPALGKDGLMIVRVPIGWFAPSYKDKQEWLSLWEELQFDPKFSRLLTRDTVKFATGIDITKATNGEQFFTFGCDVLRFNSPHLDPALIEELQYETQSSAPVVSVEYFNQKLTTQIQGSGVRKTIWRGMYYDFAGIPIKGKKGTDFDALFQKLGVGDPEHETAEQLSNRLSNEMVVILTKSDVTERVRRVRIQRQVASRVGDTQGIIAFSEDGDLDSVDVGDDPLLNLVKLPNKIKAFEVLWEMPNGLMGESIYDQNKTRLDEVNANKVAIDKTDLHGVLQPGRCFNCHAAGKSGGWRELRNDAESLLKNPRTRVLFDQNLLDFSPFQLADFLAGKYLGRPEDNLLPTARRSLAAAVRNATGDWEEDKEFLQVNVVKLVAAESTRLYSSYVWSTVDAQRALDDLGIRADKKNAPDLFTKLVLTPKNAEVPVVPADIRLELLGDKAGISEDWFSWELVYSFAAESLAKNK